MVIDVHIVCCLFFKALKHSPHSSVCRLAHIAVRGTPNLSCISYSILAIYFDNLTFIRADFIFWLMFHQARVLFPVEGLVDEVEKRNRLKILSSFLEHLLSEGSQGLHVHLDVHSKPCTLRCTCKCTPYCVP